MKKGSQLESIHETGVKYGGIKLKTNGFNYTKYKDYTTFISVRHPLDRVLSAYLNLIDSTPGLPGPAYAKTKLVQALNLTKNKPQVTLSHLVQFITDPTLSGNFYHDRHWKPYSETCQVCDIKYDYISRLETNAHDISPILEKLDYPADHLQKIQKIHGRSGDNKNHQFVTKSYIKQFQNVSKTLMDRLMQRYRIDLSMFGYHFDTSTMEATCQITDQYGKNCC